MLLDIRTRSSNTSFVNTWDAWNFVRLASVNNLLHTRAHWDCKFGRYHGHHFAWARVFTNKGSKMAASKEEPQNIVQIKKQTNTNAKGNTMDLLVNLQDHGDLNFTPII